MRGLGRIYIPRNDNHSLPQVTIIVSCVCETCQAMLAKLKTPEAVARCVASYESATNMTDSFAALSALASVPGPEREALMASFYDKWEGDALVVNKWLGLQAASNVEGNLANVKARPRGRPSRRQPCGQRDGQRCP